MLFVSVLSISVQLFCEFNKIKMFESIHVISHLFRVPWQYQDIGIENLQKLNKHFQSYNARW